MLDVIHTRLIQMPDGIMRQPDHGETHALRHLAEPLGFSVFLKAESREMDASAEDACFGEDGDAADAVEFHFDVRVAVGVAEVGEMGSPGGVLGVAFDDDGVLVEGVGEGDGGFRLLPGVEVVGLFAA
jgi:hypothetical protein